MSSALSQYKPVFMGEAVFGSAKDPSPVLATEGLRSCIGFAGWDSVQKIGFLVHFGGPSQVTDFYQRGFKILAELSKGGCCTFSCVLKGGSQKTYTSGEIIAEIKKGLRSSPDISLEIVAEEVPSKGYELKSLSLDTRDGTFGGYDSSEDVSPRRRTEEEEARLGTFASMEMLFYHGARI